MLLCFIIQSDKVVFGDMLEFAIGHEEPPPPTPKK